METHVLIIFLTIIHISDTVHLAESRHTSSFFCDRQIAGHCPTFLAYQNQPDEHNGTEQKQKEPEQNDLNQPKLVSDVLGGKPADFVNDNAPIGDPNHHGVPRPTSHLRSLEPLDSPSSLSRPVGDVDHCNPLDIYSLDPPPEIKGLEYLGNGYDVTKAKPFGDLEEFVDTGFTQPIIRFTWSCHSKTKKSATPLGVWVRREPSCHRGHSTREISNEESLGSVLSEDVTSSFGVGIIAANYSKQKNETRTKSSSKQSRQLAIKSQCAVFTAGMLLSNNWLGHMSVLIYHRQLTYAFRNALKPLLDFQDKDKCQEATDFHEGGSCHDYYQLWKNFFGLYGTHLISRLTMGGKVLQVSDDDAIKNAEEARREKLVSSLTNILLFNVNVDTKKENQNSNAVTKMSSNTKFFIMGGDSFIDVSSVDGMKKWMESVENNSMPIKLQLAPVSYFMPLGIRKHFWNAFNLYTKKPL